MHQDLIAIIQEIVASVGTAGVVVLARALNRRLSRLVLTMKPKPPRQYRFTVEVGSTRITVTVGISRKPEERKSLSDPEGDERDDRGGNDH